jgi:hypothetical protein
MSEDTARGVVGLMAAVCFLAAVATVVRGWPELGAYPVVVAGSGVVLALVAKFASADACRRICTVVSLGTWR